MKTILTILTLGLTAAALAQIPATELKSDDTFFHPAASMYIHGDSAGASNLVAQGLSVFPDDGKLKRLKELLEQQQQDQQNQDNQDQQNQDQQDQDQQNQDQQNQDQQNQDQQNQNNDQNQDQNNDQQDQQNQDQEQQPQEPEPQRADQMSQDEAERLLDAMEQEEENKRLMLRPVRGAPVKVDKDW